MSIKYCNLCKRNVQPQKKMNFLLLIVLLVLGVIPGIIYYILKKKQCPICGGRKFSRAEKN